MAEIKKLASTFEAARARISVAVHEWDSMREKLKAMGLSSTVYDTAEGVVYFQTRIPLSYDSLPPHVPIEFTDVVDEFEANIVDLRNCDDLFCPPAPETCREGKKIGRCGKCGSMFQVIGPVQKDDGGKTYVMANHNLGLHVCYGTALPAIEGSVR